MHGWLGNNETKSSVSPDAHRDPTASAWNVLHQLLLTSPQLCD